jgi:hypothetical protein
MIGCPLLAVSGHPRVPALAHSVRVRFRPEADIALLFSAMARRLACAGIQRPEI